MTARLFSELGLSPESLKAVARLGFEQASPIQAETIPPLLAGHDLVGQSQTGSGKTAAFTLPALERILPDQRGVQVLILCPTRELAVQVSEEVHKLAFFKKGIRSLPIYGGQSYERQFAGLKAGVQIVIGTPGRVMDHINRGTLRLDTVRTVILDEADEMLDMGFRDDIEFILQRVPATRQTVLFSATIPRPIEELIQRYTRNPQRIHIESKALTVPTVEQVWYEVDRRWKFEALTRLIELHDVKLAIVFCNTQRMVDELTEHLNAGGFSADAIHGGMAQSARDRVMGKFRKGGLEFLVATDVAARGIDVEAIEVVFNYDLPYDPEDYVHRIGRTGRAGRSGLAISFASGREVFAIRQIERFTRGRLRRGEVPSHGEIEAARQNQLIQRVRATLTAGDYRHYDHLIEALLEEGIDSIDLANALLHQLARGTEEPTGDAKPRSAPPPERPPERPNAPARKPVVIPPPPGTAGKSTPPPARDATLAGAVPGPKKRFEPAPAPVVARASSSPAPVAARVIPTPPKAVVPSALPPHPPVSHLPGQRPPRPKTTGIEAMTRLWLSAGAEHGVESAQVVGCILGETGLPADVVGPVDVRERHTFAAVAAEHVSAILAKLNRANLAGRRLKAKVA